MIPISFSYLIFLLALAPKFHILKEPSQNQLILYIEGWTMARIVVLDDDEIVRNVVVRTLELDRHTVQAFPDARPALEQVDFDQVDLVITDLSMPTPGEIAIRTLRSRGIQIPILVMSGHVEEDKARYLISLGAQQIINKPFSLKNLLNVVQTLI